MRLFQSPSYLSGCDFAARVVCINLNVPQFIWCTATSCQARHLPPPAHFHQLQYQHRHQHIYFNVDDYQPPGLHQRRRLAAKPMNGALVLAVLLAQADFGFKDAYREHHGLASCNSQDKTHPCWGSLGLEVKGNNNATWYVPNVTSMNCSYTVPPIPKEYNGQSIFLWCGLQPGGSHGVLQPQIMYGKRPLWTGGGCTNLTTLDGVAVVRMTCMTCLR